MKRKYILLLLVLVLLVPIGAHPAQAADTKLASISVPITTGLMGNKNSAKSFTLDLPNGVSASAIPTSSLKYTGNNDLVGSVAIENGKLKVTLKGIVNSKTMEVKGYSDRFEKPFTTNIGNSIWRYSDGRRWQINEYLETTNTLGYHDVNGADSTTPSLDPPKTLVAAASDQSATGRIWYASKTEPVDNQYVIASTISTHYSAGSSYLKGEPKFKNGKIITNYFIPTVGVAWNDQTADATMPITGWVQGRFYSAFVNYYYTATANVTTYSYGGMINLDYALPDEATLNATATLVKPSPNPIKLDGNKVDVQISVKGELLAYTNTSNIEEWVFYAKEKNKNDTLVMKKEYLKILASTKAFDFEIPASRVVNDNFKQDYSLTVVVRFKKPVVTKTGTITSLEQSLEISVGVYKKDNPVTYPTSPTTPTKPEGKPPIARISAPKYIKAGDDMMVYGGASSDPDGYITDYAWGTQGAQGEIGNNPRGYIWYTREQVGETFPIALTVVDNDGQIGSTSTEVTVIEPKPAAIIEITGNLKQNRKTTLVNRSQSPTRFPLIKAKTQVTISAVSGGTNSDIKYSGTLAELESKDMLFKKPGKYRATIYAENTAGYASSSEITFDIVPDEVPFAYFAIPSKVYRDPSNGNKALVSIDDMSFSKDKDPLVRRIWEYRYDSNNNGIFTDEHWVTFSEENTTRLNLELYQVGKYEIRLAVFEEFGQPTLEMFVTDADRQRIDSGSTQNVIERIVEVNNRAPEVDWDL